MLIVQGIPPLGGIKQGSGGKLSLLQLYTSISRKL